jgi:hypothetical protein
MPANEDGEGAFIAASHEGVKQLFIAIVVALLYSQLVVQAAKTVGQYGATHERDPKCWSGFPA